MGLAQKDGGVTIFLNSTEFTRLRAAKETAVYNKMLKNAIIHETVHVYLNTHGQRRQHTVSINRTGYHLVQNPTPGNDLNSLYGTKTDWGDLFDYVDGRFPTDDGPLTTYRKANYKKHYLDISGGAQQLIDAILKD